MNFNNDMEQQLFSLDYHVDFNVINIRDVSLIRCLNKLNIYNVSSFNNIIDVLISQHKKSVLVSLAEVFYIDSSGLGVLLVCMRKLYINGSTFKIIGPSKNVIEVFERSQLSDLFEVFQTEDDAIRSCLV